MHAMVCAWLLFTLMLFVIEPFILHRHFHKWATEAPDAAFTGASGALDFARAQPGRNLWRRRGEPGMSVF
ncbi:hypothetical protein MPC4_160026 [Methylocella tundrae]|uniref:Uncharacterized protein n=1 Tax=Methylocella tundrae TaxID=227605 RepID=A0A8B6M3I1_METTU|nr:hypothetical protein MPC1_990005 [Methylocella tundrae]VTZ49376.1 hypothetical protein MPC4_160026 [Methylocella tundrae]